MAHPLLELAEQVLAAAPAATAPVRGAADALSLDDLFLVYRIAWCCDEETFPALRVRLPEGTSWRPGPAPERCVVEQRGGEALVGLPPQGLRAAGPLLATLPEGSGLELATANITDAEERAGNQRFAGVVAGGRLQLERTCPPLDGETLAGALALARSLERGEPLLARTEAERDAVLDDARNDPTQRDGWVEARGLELVAASEPKRPLLASLLFRHRFRGAFDVEAAERLDHEVRQQVRAAEAALTALSDLVEEREVPREVLLEGTATTFWRTDLARRSGPEPERLAALGEELARLGFTALGDLECARAAGLVYRAFSARSGDQALVACPGTAEPHLALFSTLADGAALITTQAPLHWEDPTQGIYRESATTADAAGLARRHAARLEALGATRRRARGKPSLAALARDMDAVLTRMPVEP